MDLDGDGRTDVLSGSFPGQIYFFRRLADGTFAAGETLKDRHGKEINPGFACSAFAVDWDGNGTIDLLAGNINGEVFFIPNEGQGKELAFGEPRRLEADGIPIQVKIDAAPVAADWDGDGKLDLIVGSEEGSVLWYRNVSSAGEPKLEAARTLVGESPSGWRGDVSIKAGQWGLRVKPCVVDWDGDGRLDLLLGDRCGGFTAKPMQTEEEKAEERQANEQMPGLRKQWAATFQEYRQLQTDPPDEPPEAKEKRLQRLETLRQSLQRTKDEIAAAQAVQDHYKEMGQAHGFVWLFQRRPFPK